jgi:hypothetical protein
LVGELLPERAVRGIVEGFYGTPWSWDDRVEVGRYCAARGMTHYVYAPKDDPAHRQHWRELYGPEELAGFEAVIEESGLVLGFGISPGLDIDAYSYDDREALHTKVDQVVELGAGLVMLALDDIPFDPAGGPKHAALARDLAEHLAGRADVILIPTEYVGMSRTRYLDDLARLLPPEIPIGWTGPAVVNDSITGADARARAEALRGRRPLLWDNYPVNDATMVDRLHLGPLLGRDDELLAACSGYLTNPMVQPRCSALPLASICGWLRGEDPVEAWIAEAGALRVFAEACDGRVPIALAEDHVAEADGPQWAAAARPLAEWLAAAAACEAPGLEEEAADWLRQVHREARLGLSALRLIQASRPVVTVDGTGAGQVIPPQPDAALAEALSIAARWPRLRRSEHTVMGPRCSFRPMLRQRADGDWRMDAGALEDDRNAIDAVVRAALATIEAVPDEPGPVELLVEGERVRADGEGRFEVRPGVEVVALSGSMRTTQLTPCTPPVPPA